MMDENVRPRTLQQRRYDSRPRDAGLLAAIEAAGGILALGRKLGLSQAAVSRWRSVPPHRVLEIERQTGLPRKVLRPDLHADG